MLDVGHLAAEQVLEHPVAVEAGAVLADLREPGPDLSGRRRDGDRARLARPRRGHDAVARQRHRHLGVGGAPAPEPGTRNREVDGQQSAQADQQSRDADERMFELHADTRQQCSYRTPVRFAASAIAQVLRRRTPRAHDLRRATARPSNPGKTRHGTALAVPARRAQDGDNRRFGRPGDGDRSRPVPPAQADGSRTTSQRRRRFPRWRGRR